MRVKKMMSSPSKKNILFLIDGLSGGGAEKVVLTLSEAMVQSGHHVTLISLRDECAYELPAGIDVHLLNDSYRGPLRRQTEIRRRAGALDRLLRRLFAPGQIDLVVSNLPKCDRIVLACPALRGCWFCLHNALQAGRLGGLSGLRRWRKLWQLRRMYGGQKLITVSQSLQADLQACGIVPTRAVAIHNPFDIERIRALSREVCPLEGQSFVLHVGRFHPQKRHDRLLEAFRLSGYPGKLVLLGQGEAERTQAILAQARQLGIADRVVLAGFVRNPFAYMRAAQALMLSSDYEGFGNAIVEALICGTPVVSTDCPHGPREILRGELARGLCRLDAQDMARALQDVLLDPPAIPDDVARRFSVEQAVTRYLALAA